MYRQLRRIDIVPTAADFSMVAVGPLFCEQGSFADHKPLRDRMAGMEASLANELRRRGYTVVGTHSAKYPVSEHDREAFEEIVAGVAVELG
ncbi:MAG: hypothetical protein IH621_09285 [Krumholzibacteria bacterium]|nr:hypothetical protein [Candidatus Krumholzibacteria bacterium]